MQNRIILDSVTHMQDTHRGKAIVCASHGGLYAGYYAAKMGVGAIVFNDAGVGRDRAGVAGVKLLDDLGTPAATISHRSARIGDGADTAKRGRISYVNPTAKALGVTVGQSVEEVMQIWDKNELIPSPPPAPLEEARYEAREAGGNGVRVMVLDSMSLVDQSDAGHIVVAASHGGLMGGNTTTAIKVNAFAALLNDADRGMDDAGISRLPVFDQRGIAGGCVSAFTARIGDGRSMLQDGVISACNETARKHGGRVGQRAQDFVAAMVEARMKEITQ